MPKVFIVLLIAIPAILLTAVISFTVWRWGLHREINARIASIQKAGLPVDWKGLSTWPSMVPDKENAAFVITNAIAHLQPAARSNQYQFELPRRRLAVSAKDRAFIVGAVQSNQAALDIVCSVTNYSKSRYPIDYLKGPFAPTPHLQGLKGIAKLLEYQAFLQAEAGDPAKAAMTVKTSIDVARSLEDEPILLSQLVSASMLRTAYGSLERVVSRIQLSDDDLAKLGECLTVAEATNRFLTAIIGERAWNGEIIRLANEDPTQLRNLGSSGGDDGESGGGQRRSPAFGWSALGFFERDRNFYLRAMETNLFVVSNTPPASLLLRPLCEKISQEVSHGLYPLSRILLPNCSRLANTDASTRACLRTAIAATAIERWRLAHQGTPPNSLQELVPSLLPAVPTDPFDGQPLRYKRLSKGYIVYSIGEGAKPDRGRESSSVSTKITRGKKDSSNITFTVER